MHSLSILSTMSMPMIMIIYFFQCGSKLQSDDTHVAYVQSKCDVRPWKMLMWCDAQYNSFETRVECFAFVWYELQIGKIIFYACSREKNDKFYQNDKSWPTAINWQNRWHFSLSVNVILKTQKTWFTSPKSSCSWFQVVSMKKFKIFSMSHMRKFESWDLCLSDEFSNVCFLYPATLHILSAKTRDKRIEQW